MDKNYQQLSAEDVLKKFDSSADGLSQKKAEQLLSQYGKNSLTEQKNTSLVQKFIEQFKNLMIIILLISAVIAWIAGDLSDAVIIFLVVVLNAVFGVFQEAKAENAINALKEMTTAVSKVKRDKKLKVIKSVDLVPGDIVVLEAGDIIPADLRLIEANSLKVEEAALTGESVPVQKNTVPAKTADLPLGDQQNMAFMNTNVTYGTGSGIVVATGMQTQVGKIAKMLNETEQTITPLQKNITHLSKILTFLVLGIAVIVFLIGTVTQRQSWLEMLLTAISLAVAAIPEGLPAIVTITLALGTQVMARKKALVRRLPAVETLGATEIIASDKTGTLTQNKMSIEKLYTFDHLFSADEYQTSNQDRLIQAMILANDSQLTEEGLLGDPTETALIQFNLDKNFNVSELQKAFLRIAELPFDSERKLMSAIVQTPAKKQKIIFTKGAVDELLKRTDRILDQGNIKKISPVELQKIEQENQKLAGQALRVLAFAYSPLTDQAINQPSFELEKNLIFIGLVGMIDPQRPEAKQAIVQAKAAGIKVLMITGDHQETAAAIATRLKIIEQPTDKVIITGKQLDQLSPVEFKQRVGEISVYARVAPEHKVRIVKAWQKRGKIVAMTGDGVNDAPALKAADIGIGMGITGTEVSKNASDIVLADDNFATIIAAVREGRRVFANIQKAIQYLLSANLGEVLTLFFMTLLGWDIFAPAQILWINLVTDTFPAIALGIQRAEDDVMTKSPRGAGSNFFSNGVFSSIIYQGILEGCLTLGVYWFAILYPFHHSTTLIHADALTMAFATLGLIQLFHAFNSKSIHKTVFTRQIFNNRLFNWSILLSAALLFSTIVIPTFNSAFKVTQLAWQQWLIVLLGGILMLAIVEIVKFFQRKFWGK
jgi:Ca2+-transporting ATPase